MKHLLQVRANVLMQLKDTLPVKLLLGPDPAPEKIAALNDIYVRYLQRIAHQYAPHSPVVMALAASRCKDSHPELARYLLHHAGEEKGHNEWALKDLQALRVPEKDVQATRPVPSCAAMIGYTYYVAGYANPIGLFGWMYILEAVGSDLGEEAATNLKQKLRLTDEAIRFVGGHGQADQVHTREIADQIEKHVKSVRKK